MNFWPKQSWKGYKMGGKPKDENDWRYRIHGPYVPIAARDFVLAEKMRRRQEQDLPEIKPPLYETKPWYLK